MELYTDIENPLGFILDDISEIELLQSLSIGAVFYVTRIRFSGYIENNVENYFDGSFFDCFQGAAEYAEKNRKQGARFKIIKIPAVVLKSNSKMVVVTQINTKVPFEGYVIDLAKISVGVKLYEAVKSFAFYSRSWREQQSSKDSIVFLNSPGFDVELEPLVDDRTEEWDSIVISSKHYLDWDWNETDIRCRSVKEILSVFDADVESISEKSIVEGELYNIVGGIEVSTRGNLSRAMMKLNPESLREINERLIPLNKMVAEERAKEKPNYNTLMSAYEGIHKVSEDFGLPTMYDIEKVRKEISVKTN